MTTKIDPWLLPDGIEEMLPDQAQQIERLRRELIDLFTKWGYDYVIPPMLEFTDSLLTGTGQDIDLMTFKLIDQVSGRTLGLRADITPQAARMDAHSLRREGVNRLCYAGHVLHTEPKSPLGSRSPIKAGVELFGASGADAEVEVVSLLLETLSAVGLPEQYIDLGHVGIFKSLAEAAKINESQIATLFSLLQSKALSDIDAWLEKNIADEKMKFWLAALSRLSGGYKIIEEALSVYKDAPAPVLAAINDVKTLADVISQRYPQAQLYFDLSELRGYHYHTGIVFGAFAPGVGNAIASGGRYDSVGQAFGRSRAATGFDVDLSAICRLILCPGNRALGIFAPAHSDPSLWEEIKSLRDKGERVVVGLNGQSAPHEYQNCDRQIIASGDSFSVEPL